MKVFLINYGGYMGNSGVHIHFLANALVAQGVDCFVVLPDGGTNPGYFGEPHYSFLSFEEIVHLAQRGGALFKDALFHVWTPRELVRPLTEALSIMTGRPYVVHLEDNEEHILEARSNRSFAELKLQSATETLELDPFFISPLHYEEFLQNAAGITCIVATLKRFVPEGVPSQVFWPACEEAFFRLPAAPNMAVREQLGFDKDEIVLAYPGAIHVVNEHIIESLYLSLALLHQQGYRVRLIRAGFESPSIKSEAAQARDRFVVHVGNVVATELPVLVGAANIVVQPGQPGPYDDYRFPSKLPFFLASGRPLVTARTNLGQHLKHEEHCLILQGSTAQDIADNVIRLIENPEFGRTLGTNGRAFARKYFSWDKSATKVKMFYERILAGWNQ